MQSYTKRLACLLTGAGSLALTTGCSTTSHYVESMRLPLVYRLDIQQGNMITQDMLTQLERGMDKSKVRFIMGTPLVADVFHQDRWDYVYTMRNGSERPVQRRLCVFFEDDRLARLEGDVKPAQGALAHVPRPEVTVDVPATVKPSLTERLLATIGLAGKEAEPSTKETAEDRHEESVTLATTRERRDPLLAPETDQ